MNDRDKSSEPEARHEHPRTVEGLHNAQLELARSARHELTVATPALDPAVWNSAAMKETLGHLIAGQPRNRVRLVLVDTEYMLSACSRLVELARRFSDLLLVRRAGEPHLGLSEMFAIADRSSCLVQRDIRLVDATLDLETPQAAAPYIQRFDEIWQASEPVPGLHGFRL